MACSKQLDHFEDFSDDELEQIRQDLIPKNTKKSENKCDRIFTAYLLEKGKDPNCWLYDEPTLDKILGKFHVRNRTQEYSITGNLSESS